MTELFIYLALTAIQILATKTQAGPKAATLKEFDVPVSEDGRELAWVFGRVRLKDFNVTWHGDLTSKEIRKRMGFKKQTVAFDYWLKAHLALCIGPVNKAGRCTYNKKKLKESGPGDNNVVDIPNTAEGLVTYLGEDKYFKNGILQGTNTYSGRVRYHAGYDDQPVVDQWKDKPDNNAYRGVVTVDLFQQGGAGANWTGKRGGYIGQAPRVNLMTFDVERTTAGWIGGTWYPEKLEINRADPGGYEAYKEFNPAHMLYQAITDPRTAMGGDPQLIDDTNWRLAADRLYSENLGLSLEWAKQQTIGQFVDKVCDHIRGGVRFNESIGKFQLVLFRNDYDVETLPVYTQSNSTLLKYSPAGNVERVNAVSLKYTDVRTFELATITAHDQGAIMAQGAEIPVTVTREGITNADTAAMVLAWELHARVAPLSTIQISADRRARGLGYSGVFIYSEPTHHATPRVYRATKVVSSEVDKNQVVIDAVADIFAQQAGGWTIGEPQLPDVPPDPTDPGDPDEDDTGVGVVDSGLTAPPAVPVPGGTYIPAPGATGPWAGHEGEFATFEPGPGEGGGSWTFEPIPDHSLIYDEADAAAGGHGWFEYDGGVQMPAPWIPDLLTAKGDLVSFDGVQYVRKPVGPNGQALTADSTQPDGLRWKTLSAPFFVMRGATWVRNGAAIDTPANVVYVHCPVAGEIVKVAIGTGPDGTNGSCVVDIWKNPIFPPKVVDTITAAAKPTIAAGKSYQDIVLTGWNKTVNAGDWLAFNLDSSSLFRFISVQLFIVQTSTVS